MLLENYPEFVRLVWLLIRVLRWGIVKAEMVLVGLVFLVLGKTLGHGLILNRFLVVYAVVVTVKGVFLSILSALLFCNRAI